MGLEKFRNKILIANKHILDFNNFKVLKDLNDREEIGFIGRF